MVEKKATLKEILTSLKKKTEKSRLSLEEVLHVLSGRGRALVLLFLTLPFCQPIQIPGVSTPFGLAIAFIALRMAFGKNIWLPKKILAKKFSSKAISKIVDKTLWLLHKTKRFTHPRLKWFCHSLPMQITTGVVIFLLGLFMALPLPIPLSNMIAAWSILFFSLGVLEDDGLFVLIGAFIFLLLIGLCLLAWFLWH
ncbi:MAG: exopolysaccharide biosynthesis protein [Verrucomicrobia bacterium]|nr:exopolysaccharide biosynthesis protein [Verrucomicrobiota bacterium]